MKVEYLVILFVIIEIIFTIRKALNFKKDNKNTNKREIFKNKEYDDYVKLGEGILFNSPLTFSKKEGETFEEFETKYISVLKYGGSLLMSKNKNLKTSGGNKNV